MLSLEGAAFFFVTPRPTNGHNLKHYFFRPTLGLLTKFALWFIHKKSTFMRQVSIIAIMAFLLINFLACSKKVADTTSAPDPEVTQPPVKEAPKSPCAEFGNLTGADKEAAETAFVIYKDFMKVKNYQEALTHWKVAYRLAPGSNGRVKSHFEDGAAIYKYFFDQTQDKNLKKAYVDTIMMIYDKRKECFGDEAYVNGLKGFDYYYNYSEYTTDDNIFQLLKSNYDVKGKNADYFVVNPFTKLLVDKVSDGKVSASEGRKYADLIMQSISTGKASCKGTLCQAWDVINEYAPARLEGLEGIEGFYDCEYYAKKYYDLFKLYPDSCELVNLAYARMQYGRCPQSDARVMEVQKVQKSKCYVAPPAIGCAAQGNENYSNGKYAKAIESYLSCVDQASSADQKSKYLLLVAKIYYRDLRNYSKARKFALDAAKARPGWGEPYILIGNLYASSGPLCGTGRGWESQVVTWPALDMWAKAKSIDSGVASEANALINRYRQYMPSKEDIFFRNIKAGDSYFVPCWIQETTTVRTSD